MKLLLWSLLPVAMAFCTGQPPTSEQLENDPPHHPTSPRCAVDTHRVAILPYETWLGLGKGIGPSASPLTMEEIEEAECLLIPAIAQWNEQKITVANNDRIDLHSYSRQYCALQNDQGHRLVYLNAYCGRRGSMAQGWVMVKDGGACYFQALFDLTAGTVLGFSVNGHA